MKARSLKSNVILNGIRTLIAVIFPLITFPYVSRILQVENLGKVTFSSSIITYFSLIATLGISNYAIREGARLKGNKENLNNFSSEIFSINLISTIFSYVLLFISITLIPSFQDYSKLLIIQSSTIIFTTIGVDWIYSIYEDYFYITIRSVITQIVSLCLLLLLVKEKNDYYLYALVNVISSVGSNIFNFFHSKKYCDLKFVINKNLIKHIKPILIIFSTSIATIIYVNLDITLLGIWSGDYFVGLYSVSVKVYSIIKTFLASILIVSLPRLSFYIAENRNEEYYKVLNKVLNLLVLILLPSALGMFLLSDEIIMLLSGSSYLPATNSLRFLCIGLIFSLLAWFISSSILLPFKKESSILKSTIIGAITNLLLNIILIPFFQQNGAAIATAIAEFIVLLISYFYARKLIDSKNIKIYIFPCFAGALIIIVVSIILKNFISNDLLYTVFTIFFSTIFYFVCQIVFKNQFVLDLLRDRKIKHE